MYNAEQKERYIEYRKNDLSEGSIKNHIYLFNAISEMEEELDKDCCNFSVAEIIGFYKRLNTSSSLRLIGINIWFKNYTSFCLSEFLVKDCQNHYEEITAEVIISCLNRIKLNSNLYTRKQVLHLCNQMLNASDKFLVLALFEGIHGKAARELTELKFEDFYIKDGKYRVKLCTERDLEVSEELYKFAKESSNTYELLCYSANNEIKSRDCDPTDPYIIKANFNTAIPHSQITDVISQQRVKQKMMRIRKGIGMEESFTAKILLRSGRAFMIKKICYEEHISCREAILAHADEISYNYTRILSIPNFESEMRDFLNIPDVFNEEKKEE